MAYNPKNFKLHRPNTIEVGPLTLNTGAPGNSGLLLISHSTQQAPLLVFRNPSNVDIGYITTSGDAKFRSITLDIPYSSGGQGPSGPPGSGISSINNLTASAQSLVLDNNGVSPAIVSAGSTHTFSIPLAGTNSSGVIVPGPQVIGGRKTIKIANTNDSGLVIQLPTTNRTHGVPPFVIINSSGDLVSGFDRYGRLIDRDTVISVADGNSHPLSEKYATLEAAQADYPFATSLTDEQDWANIQRAVWRARNTEYQGGGGAIGRIITIPPGTYRINKTIIVSGVSTLTIRGYGQATKLNWVGPVSGTMIDCICTYACDFEKFALDQDTYLRESIRIINGGTGPIPTNCKFEQITFHGLPNIAERDYCIYISAEGPGGHSNNELHKFINCNFVGYKTAGIRILCGQAHAILIEDCQFGGNNYGLYGVYAEYGAFFYVKRGSGGFHTAYDFFARAFMHLVEIDEWNSEGSAGLLQVGVGTCAGVLTKVSNTRWSTNAPISNNGAFVYGAHMGTLEFCGNLIDSTGGPGSGYVAPMIFWDTFGSCGPRVDSVSVHHNIFTVFYHTYDRGSGNKIAGNSIWDDDCPLYYHNNLFKNEAGDWYLGDQPLPQQTFSYLNRSNVWISGVQKIITGLASTTGLIIQAASGQTANLTEWRDYNNNLLGRVDAAGNAYFNNQLSGLSSINSLSASHQFLRATSSGTTIHVRSENDTHYVNFPPAGVNNNGLVTTGTQTFSGSKTFYGNINFPTAGYFIYWGDTNLSISAPSPEVMRFRNFGLGGLATFNWQAWGVRTVLHRFDGFPGIGSSALPEAYLLASFQQPNNSGVGVIQLGTYRNGLATTALPAFTAISRADINYSRISLAGDIIISGACVTLTQGAIADTGLVIRNVANSIAPFISCVDNLEREVIRLGGSGNIIAKSFAGSTVSLTGNAILHFNYYNVLVDASAGPVWLTLPSLTTMAEKEYRIKKIDNTANAVTVSGSPAQLIDGANTFVLDAQWDAFIFVGHNNNWYIW